MATASELVKKQVKGDIDKKIMSFLTMIAENTLNDKADRDAKNELIRDLFDEGFQVQDPTGTKKIGSKVIQQAMWRVMSKVKFLDCAIHGTKKSENTERLVTEGVMTVADRGRLGAVCRGKDGVFFNSFLYGDGFLSMGKGENDENPVSYRVIRNEDVYFDTFCNGVRATRPANKMAVIYQYDKEEAYEMWSELEENNIYGRIPGTYQGEDNQSERDYMDVVEVCWAWNRTKKQYVIFAGAQAFELDYFEGEEYPFIKNNSPYIPVYQFLCQPRVGTPWNGGVGDLVYDLAIITRKLLNLEVTHLEDNVLPFTFVNAPQSKVDEMIEKMAMANEARKTGKKPFVAMEMPAGGGGATAQSLITQNLFNEWNVVWDRLYREISRLGINLDDIERGQGITRGQVIAEEQASNAFVLQMMEYNGEDTKELMECTMDAITEFVNNKNKTPLNLRTKIMLEEGGEVNLDTEITMGMLSKTLKDGNWFVVPDLRSGAPVSDLVKMIQEERLIQMTPPGTPEYMQLFKQIAMRQGVDLQGKQQAPPQAPPQASPQEASQEASQGAPQGAPEGAPPAAGTQRVLPEMTGNAMQPV